MISTSVGNSVEVKVNRSSLAASRPRIDNVSLLRIACFEGSNSASAAVMYVTLRFILKNILRKKRTRKRVERRCIKLCPSVHEMVAQVIDVLKVGPDNVL